MVRYLDLNLSNFNMNSKKCVLNCAEKARKEISEKMDTFSICKNRLKPWKKEKREGWKKRSDKKKQNSRKAVPVR